jgi:hypothetical protein
MLLGAFARSICFGRYRQQEQRIEKLSRKQEKKDATEASIAGAQADSDEGSMLHP